MENLLKLLNILDPEIETMAQKTGTALNKRCPCRAIQSKEKFISGSMLNSLNSFTTSFSKNFSIPDDGK